jgi:hypothetical protein
VRQTELNRILSGGMGQFIHEGFDGEHIDGEPHRPPEPHRDGKVHHDIVHPLVRDGIGHVPDARNGIRIDAVLHHSGRQPGPDGWCGNLMRPADQPAVLVQSGLDAALAGRTEIVVGKIIFAGIHDLDRAVHAFGQQYRIRHMDPSPRRPKPPPAGRIFTSTFSTGRPVNLGRMLERSGPWVGAQIRQRSFSTGRCS